MIRISFSLSTKVGNLSYICILLPIFYSRCASGRVFGRTPVFIERGQLRRFLFKRNAGCLFVVRIVHLISKTASIKSLSFLRLLATGECQIASVVIKSRESGYFYQVLSIYFMFPNDFAGVFGETKITFGWNGEGSGGTLVTKNGSTVYCATFIHFV